MDPRAIAVALATARRLAEDYGEGLVLEVQKVCLNDRRPAQYADKVAVAALIVSVAGVAWTVYHDVATDLRADDVTVQIEIPGDLAQDEVARIVDVVIDEIRAVELDTEEPQVEPPTDPSC